MTSSEIQAVTLLAPEQIGEPAVEAVAPVEWWYTNVQLEAPGTPVDRCALVVVFSRFRGVIEEVRRLLVPADGSPIVDFGSGRLGTGSISASAESLDVRHETSWLRGGYPDYALDAEGERDGVRYAASLTGTAEIPEDRLAYVDGQLRHYVVYRVRYEGTVSVGADDYRVTGLGLFEHLTGTFGAWSGADEKGPVIDGWDWYWSPAAGPKRVVVQASGLLSAGKKVPFALLCVDDESFVLFDAPSIETLEVREARGVSYPRSLRFSASNDRGELELVVTRSDAASVTTSRGRGSGTFFLTGFAEARGHATIDGTSYDLDGRIWGGTFRAVNREERS
jgi:hypothetical protein